MALWPKVAPAPREAPRPPPSSKRTKQESPTCCISCHSPPCSILLPLIAPMPLLPFYYTFFPLSVISATPGRLMPPQEPIEGRHKVAPTRSRLLGRRPVP